MGIFFDVEKLKAPQTRLSKVRAIGLVWTAARQLSSHSRSRQHSQRTCCWVHWSSGWRNCSSNRRCASRHMHSCFRKCSIQEAAFQITTRESTFSWLDSKTGWEMILPKVKLARIVEVIFVGLRMSSLRLYSYCEAERKCLYSWCFVHHLRRSTLYIEVRFRMCKPRCWAEFRKCLRFIAVRRMTYSVSTIRSGMKI